MRPPLCIIARHGPGKYCKKFAKVIKEANKVYYGSVILKSNNKIKTTWSIIKKETGYKNHKDKPQSLKINNIIIKDKGHIVMHLMNISLQLHKQL
jgi:hypothetical protein